MTTCEGCVYRGREFEYLRGHRGTDEWLECRCPVPWWVTSSAVPADAEGVCSARVERTKRDDEYQQLWDSNKKLQQKYRESMDRSVMAMDVLEIYSSNAYEENQGEAARDFLMKHRTVI